MNSNVSTATAGYTIAAILAIIANTLLVYAKETNPALLAAMKSLAHHWVVQGVVITLLFLVLGLALSKWPWMRRMNGTFLALLLILATVAAGVALVVFFLAE
jgi:putative flippase GtrA